MKLFDSHVHLDVERYHPTELEGIIDRAWDEGLVGMIAIAGATEISAYEQTLRIAENHQHIWVGAGIHPHIASYASNRAIDKLRYTLDHAKVIALGEIGLDYHYNHTVPKEQRQAFVRQLRMAHEVQLPVIIHTRDAEADTIAILRDEGAESLGGVIHCFSAAASFGDAALELGLYLSFSGIVTFPKATAVQEVAAKIPPDRILAETDAPFLSPVPFRGRPNEPARVRYVVEQLARLRDCTQDDMATQLLENTQRAFGLDAEQLR